MIIEYLFIAVMSVVIYLGMAAILLAWIDSNGHLGKTGVFAWLVWPLVLVLYLIALWRHEL